jgi:hypothetical protein
MPVRCYGYIILSYDMQYLSSPYLSTLIKSMRCLVSPQSVSDFSVSYQKLHISVNFLLIAMFNHGPRQIIMWSILLTLLLGNTLTDLSRSANLDLFLCINKKKCSKQSSQSRWKVTNNQHQHVSVFSSHSFMPTNCGYSYHFAPLFMEWVVHDLVSRQQQKK